MTGAVANLLVGIVTVVLAVEPARRLQTRKKHKD